MKTLIFFILLIISSSCCSLANKAPGHIKKGFTYKYEEKVAVADSLINMNGYFQLPIVETRYNNDTTYCNVMFFPNGLMIYHFYIVNAKHKENIAEYFKEVIRKDSLGLTSFFYEYSNWGCYHIRNDTIKAQYVYRSRGGLNDHWDAYEVWFKVIDRNTLLQIYNYPIYGISKSDLQNFFIIQKRKISLPAKFIQTEVQPSSDGWIKREKWFWRDEQDWKAYMEKRRTNKND